MGFKKWFGRDEEPPESTYIDYNLSTLQVGFLVDYDLKTWQVTGYGTYDYEGFITKEWELTADGNVHFLERAEEDGKAEWTLTRAIGIDSIDGDVAAAIIADGDPPEAVVFEGDRYEGTESGAGLYRKGGDGPEREFVNWSFAGAEGRVLYISQWGDRDFASYVGCIVEEYQFTDILPAGEA